MSVADVSLYLLQFLFSSLQLALAVAMSKAGMTKNYQETNYLLTTQLPKAIKPFWQRRILRCLIFVFIKKVCWKTSESLNTKNFSAYKIVAYLE